MPPDWKHLLFPASPDASRPASRPASGPSTPRPQASGWETGLEPTVVEKARQLQALARQEGIEVGIVSGHRTREEQERIYAQGRTTRGPIITKAKPGTSRHETGRAIDVVPLKDGKPDWESPYWGRLGELGKGVGFEWGGEWRTFKDRPHFQLPPAPAASQSLPRTRSGVGRLLREGVPAAIPGEGTLSPTFRTKVGEVARRLKMDPQHLLTVMSFETAGTFDPAQRNLAGSGATGLIQMLPSTARSLGTTTDDLARMTPEQQLDYVERYFQPYKGRMRTAKDAYLAVLSPAAIGKPAEHVLFPQGTRAYEQNKALDKDQKGYVTVGDTTQSVARHLGARGTAAPQPVDWASELFVAQAAAPSPVSGQGAGVTRAWAAELGLGGEGSAPTTPAPVSSTGQALERHPGARAGAEWGQALGLAPAPRAPPYPGTGPAGEGGAPPDGVVGRQSELHDAGVVAPLDRGPELAPYSIRGQAAGAPAPRDWTAELFGTPAADPRPWG